MEWKYKNKEKISQSKSEVHKETIDNSHTPLLNTNPNLSAIFNEENTIYKDQRTRTHIYRQAKARQEQDNKIERLTNDLGKQAF